MVKIHCKINSLYSHATTTNQRAMAMHLYS